MQIQVEGFGQIDQRGLGGAIGQSQGESSVAGHAADETEMPLVSVDHAGQDSIQNIERAHGVDLMVAQQVGEVQCGGSHGVVVASAVAHQVERALRQQGARSVLNGPLVGDIQWHRGAARVREHEGLQRLAVSCRYHDLCAQCMQLNGQGPTDPGRRTNQPDTLAMPVANGRVQAHGVCL